MSSTLEEIKEQPIVKYWTRDEETVEKEELMHAAKALQASAESYIVKNQSELYKSQKECENARMECRNNGDFSKMVDARVRMLKLERVLEEARAVYKEQFGCEPRL